MAEHKPSAAAGNLSAQQISRRAVVKGLAASMAWAGAAPFVHASDKAGSSLPLVGSGEHTYECHHDWGDVPAHIRYSETHGVTIDDDGLIYIKHRSSGDEPMDTVVVFDPDGRFVRSFGKECHGGGHGIDIRSEGGEQFLYLSDIHNRRVLKADKLGEMVWEISYPQEPGVYESVEQYRPTNVAFAPDGGFYVGDGYGSHYVHQYDKDAKWIRTWGGEGSEPGKMKTPHGLWLDDRPGREPALIVADRANFRMQYFTLDGQHVSFLEDVLFPADVDIRGDVLLVPDLHARVSLFDADNKPIVHLGDDPEWTAEVKKFEIRKDRSLFRPGRFVHPHDACFDADGNIFVVEWVAPGRVTKLRKVS
ncbi:MAG: peptidase [Pirellulales bacterium]|nr:peptidase [Planctomycetales bacterium]